MNNLFDRIVDTFIMVVILFTTGATLLIQFNINKNSPLLIDEQFLPFFEEFKKDAAKYDVTPNFKNMTTTFLPDISDNILAYCMPKFNTIKVSRKKWDTLDHISRKLLLYHEWGHCTLKREHVEDRDSKYISVCPDSIMYPYIDPIVRCYNINTNWYDKELFTNFNNREVIP
jgi:hypothetical protein